MYACRRVPEVENAAWYAFAFAYAYANAKAYTGVYVFVNAPVRIDGRIDGRVRVQVRGMHLREWRGMPRGLCIHASTHRRIDASTHPCMLTRQVERMCVRCRADGSGVVHTWAHAQSAYSHSHILEYVHTA